jgi:NADPH:quinone reductase
VRALQISQLDGPDAVQVVDADEPSASHFSSPGEGVVIDVRAAAVSFPDVLQSRGLYQFKPELPFVPGGEVSGVVVESSDDRFQPGQRVAAMTLLGGMAERTVAPPAMTFALPDELDFAEGASLVLNYHTVLFSLKFRGRLAAGEWVLVHGAAGGIGTAGLQVAKALGAQTIGVVSTDEKEKVAREAGAEHVVRSDGSWKDEAKEISGGGVDVVLDPVGGDRFTDSLRSLRELGRVVVVGFTGGSIPEVKVNRLLLNNVDVVGAGWGAYVLSKPDFTRKIADELDEMVHSGAVKPIVGARFPLDQAADAMRLIEERGALGKVVLEVTSDS